MAATVKEIRRERLILLIEKWKAEGNKSQRALADKCSLNPVHLSQMIKGDRGMGDATARRIEKSMLLPDGYMDTQLDLEADPDSEEMAALFSQLKGERRKTGIEYVRSLLKTQAMEDELEP
ncbi:MAG: hypothetical protein R3F02_18560 [Thiolinea sp.]